MSEDEDGSAHEARTIVNVAASWLRARAGLTSEEKKKKKKKRIQKEMKDREAATRPDA